jgi:heptosyltransferase I
LTAASAVSSSVERLLIVRLSAMGDIIHTLPAAQALRDVFPNATIGWLIEERWAELLCTPGTSLRGPRSPQRPLVDWVHTVDLRGWRNSLLSLHTAERIARAWNDVRSSRYDVALDLQGAIRSAVLARWSGAPVIFGAAQPRETPASLFYTRPVIVRETHVVEQNLSIVESFVERKLSVPSVDLPCDDAAESRVTQRLREASIRDFAILNPGAGWGAKRWPAERYGLVARALAAEGLQSIVNHGPGEESLAREVGTASGGAARAFQCSISELIALTRRASLFIGGDTGPMHLAAALKTPVVAIFGPTDPARNGPYGTRSIVLRNPESSTSHARVSQPDQAMLEITVDAVANAAGALLPNKHVHKSSTGAAHG